jgi:hypothetical protein
MRDRLSSGPHSLGLYTTLSSLFLLLALSVGLVAVLMGSLGMLLCRIGVLFASGMIALPMMLSSGSMGLGCVFVVLCSFVMLISGHLRLLRLPTPALPPTSFLGKRSNTADASLDSRKTFLVV